MIPPELIQRLIRLRTLIGFLGEKPQFNWWDTQFLGKTSFGYLELNFPRTTFSAALQSVTVAAKNVHDDRIGKGFVYHLFRLPFRYEQPIAHYLHSLISVSWDDIPGILGAPISTAKDGPQGLPRNCLENRATIGRNFASVSFLQKLTDDNKTRQWDGLLRVLAPPAGAPVSAPGDGPTAVLQALSQLSGSTPHLAQGPIRLEGDSFFTVTGLDIAASYYYQAFKAGVQSFPYSFPG